MDTMLPALVPVSEEHVADLGQPPPTSVRRRIERLTEDLMLKHPQVADVAAVAKSHARLGEVVCTFVVLRGDDTLDITSVRAHFEQLGVAKQKTPEHIEIIKELPRTPSGKVKKHELRDLLKKRG